MQPCKSQPTGKLVPYCLPLSFHVEVHLPVLQSPVALIRLARSQAIGINKNQSLILKKDVQYSNSWLIGEQFIDLYLSFFFYWYSQHLWFYHPWRWFLADLVLLCGSHVFLSTTEQQKVTSCRSHALVRHKLACLRKAECKSDLIRDTFPMPPEELIQSNAWSPFNDVA